MVIMYKNAGKFLRFLLLFTIFLKELKIFKFFLKKVLTTENHCGIIIGRLEKSGATDLEN